MTCILAVLDIDGGVWMGGDRAASCGQARWMCALPKVATYQTKDKPVLMGMAGQSLDEWFRHGFIAPERGRDVDAETYIIRDFYPAYARHAKSFADLKTEKADVECAALIAHDGRLAIFGTSGASIHLDGRSWASIGSGELAALGVLHCLGEESVRGDPKSAILKALEVASEIMEGVAPPFDIINDKTA